MAFLEVRPSDDDIQASRVSLWEKDADDHSHADRRWSDDDNGFGGVYIAGNPKKPDLTYVVADTPGVRKAIKDQRLVLVKSDAQPIQPILPVVVAPAPAIVDQPIQQPDTSTPTDATPTDSTETSSGKKGK